jgi:uncharacterized protein (TIGR03435 family)
MSRLLYGIGVAALLSSVTFGQSAAPTFDVADVHIRAHSNNPAPFMTGGVLRGGRYDLRNATLLDMIRMAYTPIDGDNILGGPNWLERDRFDIVAKAPQSTSPENVRLMLQNLLADRFKLVVHKDTKPVPAFALTVAKGGKPKLKEASGEGAPGCQPPPPPSTPPDPNVVPYAVAICHGMTMEVFAQTLRGFGGGYLTSPVVDLTGLKGSWDFELKWTARALLARAGSDGITIFDAVDKQLGLKLEQQSIPSPVLVVDSANQKPSDNPSGVAQSLPLPPPAEFDVADVKLSLPDAMTQGRIQPGGQLNLQGFPMKLLVQIAFDINDDQLITNAPKWFDSTKYSVIARTSAVAAGAQPNAPQIDIDDVRLMLRALIVERFKLATHYEDRPVNAYVLLADKPKLTKADPANRTGWKEGPGNDGRDPRNTNSVLSRLVTAKNMTMAQFAEDLSRMAAGYVRIPVEDATGIEGSFDFTINFTPAGLVNGGPGAGQNGGQAQGAAPAASDPSGGLSLPDAINKQMGLKLELRKRQLPVLVIDHLEEKPTDN